jgi:uncharacterized protein (DUF1501 family)
MRHIEKLDSRRRMLKVSIAGLLGGTASGWFDRIAARAAESGRGKSCILLWMDGGPSHKDTFDMKPGSEHAGELKPIATSVAGIQISEVFPHFARQMQHAAILRGMSTPENDHFRARYHMHTGYRSRVGGVVYPSLGAIAAHELGSPEFPLPNYVLSLDGGGRSYGTASGFLGPRHQPLVVKNSTRGVENSKPPLPVEAFDRRVELLASVEQQFEQAYRVPAATAHATTVERAVEMMRSEQLTAFDLAHEPASQAEAYGSSTFGQGCLLARRLVEAGVPFVEVSSGGWDSHSRIYSDARRGIRGLAEQVDRPMSALIADLSSRGLLEDTLVIWMGEFGRTPHINQGAGRDHYSKAWSTVLAGGGIRGGQTIGRTDAQGATVDDRPVSTVDFMATICQILGIDHNKELPSPGGRPIPVVDNQTQTPAVVTELFA